MSTIEMKITTDRECDFCGYSLKGLPVAGKCPECGKPIRRLSINTKGTMTEEAPTRFVKKLRVGFSLAGLACVISYMLALWMLVASIFTGRISLVTLSICATLSLIWPAGVFIATTKRPGKGEIRPDPVLDSDRIRLIVRIMSITWPIYTLGTLALIAASRATPPSRVLMFGTGTISLLSGIGAWIGLVPTSIYFAEIAYWSSNDQLSNRLRGTAWVLAVLGTISSIVIALAYVQDFAMGLFLSFPFALIMLTTLGFFNFGVFQLSGVMRHVIKHQHLAAGSFDRMEERRKKEEQYRGRIVDDTPCEYCGHNIIGLELGSPCPECGTLASRPDRPTINDPAKSRPYHDDTPIDLDEHGENKGVYFNDQLDAHGKPKKTGVPYTPQTEVPDDGDIPLSPDDPADQPPKAIRHENKRADALKPRSFDDEH